MTTKGDIHLSSKKEAQSAPSAFTGILAGPTTSNSILPFFQSSNAIHPVKMLRSRSYYDQIIHLLSYSKKHCQCTSLTRQLNRQKKLKKQKKNHQFVPRDHDFQQSNILVRNDWVELATRWSTILPILAICTSMLSVFIIPKHLILEYRLQKW